MPDTPGGTTVLQGLGRAVGRGLVDDPITEGPIQEADHVQEAEDTMDLGEPYILKFTGTGEAGHTRDLVVGHLCI